LAVSLLRDVRELASEIDTAEWAVVHMFGSSPKPFVALRATDAKSLENACSASTDSARKVERAGYQECPEPPAEMSLSQCDGFRRDRDNNDTSSSDNEHG